MNVGVESRLELLVPRARVYSPMLEALVKGNAKHAELMLKVGADPNQKDAIGRTPLIMVSFYTDQRKAISLAHHIIKSGEKSTNPTRTG